MTHVRIRRPFLLSLVVVAIGCGGALEAHFGPPSITIESPASGAQVQGVAIIRFRTENVSIASPFLAPETTPGPLARAHVHVTVDGASWHWVHATTDPVVITPLSPGEHTVTLELAGADHRPLDVRTVRFIVAGKAANESGHAKHRL